MLIRGIVHSGEAIETQNVVEVLQRHESLKNEDNYFKKLMEFFDSEKNNEFIDPISFEIMKDPIVLSSGQVFERSSIFDEQG